MNDYDALIAQTQQADTAQSARFGFTAAADTNPDAYAEAQRVARRTGVPVDTVLNQPKEMKRQDAVGTIDFNTLAKTAPATAALLADVERAKVAHDNVDNMGEIERKFRQFGGGAIEAVGMSISGTGQLLNIAQRNILGGFASIFLPKPRAGGQPTMESIVGPLIGEDWRKVGGAVKQTARKDVMIPASQRTFGDDVASGLGQVVAQIIMLPLTRGAGLYTQGADVMAEKVAPDIASQGMKDLAVLGGAAVTGVTEKWALDRLLGPMAVPIKNQIAAALARIGIAGAAEGGQEFAENVLHDTLRKILTNPDAKIEWGQSTYEGGVGATVGAIVRSIVEAGLHIRVRGARNAQQAEQGAEFLNDLGKLAAADKVLARDSETFEQFIAQVADTGPVQTVFIDAQTLMQSGVAEQVAAVSPSVAAQLQTAIATGGQIAIPVEEYTARIAPTEAAARLLDHLKTEPEGFSRAEAQEYMQGAAAELQAEVERTLAEKQGDDTFKASAEVVRREIRTQLDAAARFTPQVNDAYSALVSNFYAVTAAKLNTTPEELFKRYPLKIGAERIDGQQFDQGQQPADVAPGEVYNQSRKGKRDDYTLDLFGVPSDARADSPAGQPAAGRQERSLSRDDAPGTYAARTELVEENTRELGTDRVTTPQEAAQALAYLAKGAVERFDALVTDADGKPLAIVGAFKGALTQASVFPSTLAAEAFRVDGAANIWFAHNHPSGSNELSNADRMLHSNLAEVFRGSEIKSRGIFAIAGKEGDGRNWVFEPTPENRYSPEPDIRGTTTAPAATASVPVVERVYTQEGRLGPAISSPAVARSVAKNLSGGEAGVVLMTAQHEPVAFVPVDPAEAGMLRRGGRMDALYRALSVSNAGAAIIVNNGTLGDQVVQNLAGLFNSLDARVLDVMDTSSDTVQSWAEQGKQFNDRTFNQGARGAFNPASLAITLLKGADLSTFLHESGHFFLEVQADIASKLQQEAEIFGMDTLKPGERQILADTDALLRWFGVRDLAEWYNLDFEQKRAYHEQFARGFEAYLFEGKAPSIELQGLFQRFRAWLLSVYRELKALNVELSDEVRGVFDRMLATNEQINLAEQGRSMMPLFTSPEQAGMTPEEFAAYQALGVDATAQAIEDLQARGLRDMRWLHNARGRIIKQLQKDAEAQRAEVRMDVRREVMSQPIYRAWQFLTGKLTAEDKIAPLPKRTSSPNSIDETQDSLFAAIAKLGGLDRAAVQSEWGIDPKERIPMPAFGKHVLRREGGLSIDAMGEALGQYGYLTLDEHGKHDLRELEEKFFEELRGNTQYSIAYDYSADVEMRAGDQVVNPEALGAGRFDLGELKIMGLPAEVINAVQARRMTAANGLHPDIVAEMFGFTSGDELVRKLAATDPPSVEIEALTDVRMLEQFGDLSSPQAIEKAADKAIHNDARARFVATEANALAKATGQRKVLASAAKEFARAMIARLKVRDLKPGQYASAEVRAAKAAEKASKAGDLTTAAAEKRNQLIQNYATRAAYDAQEEVDKGLRYLKKFEGDIKGLDADYAEQIGNLLERFDLRKGQSNKAVDKRTALAEWIKAQREAGLEPDILPELENEAFRTSYKNLTVEEFRGLVDTVRQVEHLGRLKHKLLTAADQRAYEAVRDEIAASIRENAQGREADTRTPTTNMGRAVQGLKRFWSAHIKAATWARIMDGNKDGGPMWDYFVRSANERGDQETTMRAEATAKLAEILAPVFKLGKMGGKGQFFPTINRSLNREARIALALNTGNAGNLQRLLGGEGWTEAQIMPVLQSLTAQEWAAVQAVWDHFESYRPLIAAKERRVYGKEPEWIEPQPFAVTTADGATVMLRGGYYPIKYDPAASQRAEEHADAESAKRQLQGAYTTATTRRSFTKSRAEEVSGRPLLYTLAGMYSGVNDVIHDLAWHEWLIDANRLLRSHTIDGAIREHYGPEAKQQFKSWVQDVAEGDKGAANAGEMALGRLRQGVSAAGLGFNVMSASIQFLGLTQSIVRVGAPWIGRGITKYLGNPIAATREANAMSSFMENRARTRFRELNELRNRVQDQGAFNEFVGRYAYFMMMRCQQMVDVPTWWGAYEKAIAAGNDETRAVALADQAVIDAQGGGQTKDLSAIERGGPALRLFTVFYSFMNTALNLGVAQTMGADTPKKRAKLAVDYLMLYTVPAVLGYFLKNALTPGDEDDDWEQIARKLAAEQLSYLMGLMFVVREFSEASKIITGAEGPRDYSGPAGVRGIADTLKFIKQAEQGEFDDAFRKSAINLLGDFTGLPSAQINRTITGAKALAEGKTENPAAIAFGFQEAR
ncbi:JAB domain-containing protein [Hydrogenophaga aquatica]